MVDSWNSAQLNEAVNNGSISGGGSDLPEVSASDNGDVLTVVGGAWNKATPSGHNYSTTEHEVGLWTDGTTKVYEKTFIGTAASTLLTVLDGDFAHNIIGADGYIQLADGSGLSLGVIAGVGEWCFAVHVSDSQGLCVSCGSAVYGGTYTATIRYTKSS